MTTAGRTASTLCPGTRLHGARRSATALVQLVATCVLVFSLVVVATAVSIGFARAQAVGAMREPDTGLVLTLLAVAVVVMGLLSAAAVRFAGRSRER